MTPCPLCMIGVPQDQHSKEMWARLADPTSDECRRLDECFARRQAEEGE